MNSRKKTSNPWSQNVAKKKSPAPVRQSAPTPAEVRFKEAHGKLQAAVQKHIKDYESSSEEEELESENIIGINGCRLSVWWSIY